MKITLFLTLFSVVQILANGVYSQNTRFTLAKENSRIQDVLRVIEDKSEYYFLYNGKLVDVTQRVSIYVENQTIDKTLNELFKNANISYKIYDRQVVLSPLENIAENQQQPKAINGKVTDSTKAPLPGVTVIVKGTTKGTITDTDGNYSISSVPEDGTLVFTFVGMKMQEIAVSGKTNINVVMTEEAIGIDEVVAIGYGTQKKVNLTGAVANVNSEVLESRPITSIGEGLQGTVSNLNITHADGTPGKGASFNVRGYTSLNGGSPLILVNGVPMDVNQLNPNDIDNVSVLKDAASAAIYGARAAYGVILITTKSGKSNNKPKVSLSMNYAINEPAVKFEHMDAMERMNFLDFGSLRANGKTYFTEIQREAITAHYNDPSKPSSFSNPSFSSTLWDYSANTNWSKELLRDSYPMQQYNASISGGSDRFNYYTSASYLYQEGITKHFDEKYNRYNLMTNLSYDINAWFKVGTKILINNSDKIYPPNNNTNAYPEAQLPLHVQVWPHYPVYHPDGTYATRGSVVNLVNFHENGGYRTRDINDIWITGTAKLTPVKNMTFNIDYSANIENREEVSYWREMPLYDMAGNLYGYHTYTYPNSVQKMNYFNRYYVFNAYADYENKFGKHYIKAMVGFNQENAINKFFLAGRQNLIKDEVPYINLAYGEENVGDSASEYALRSGFARFNYNFGERYLFEFNGRYDGTSKFPKVDRFAFFPSISLGWRVDNEKFFARLRNSVNMLKFRMSYGNLGNQAVGDNYPYVATFSSGQPNFVIGGEKPLAVYAPGLVSPTLTWETVTQQDIGVDIAVLDNRLSATFDIYRRDTKNMLTKGETLPALLGASEPQSNAADLKTTGFDLTIDWKHSIRNVSYGITLLLSDYVSEITRFSNPTGLIDDYYVGKKLGTIWGLETGGFFKTDEEAQALDQKQISGRKRFAGDIFFVDQNGDSKITRGSQTLGDHGDMKIIGNSTPRYSFGIKPYVKWNGFDLTVFFQGVGKRDTWLNTAYFLTAYTNQWTGFHKVVADFWTPENTDAYFPAPTFLTGADVTTVQSHFLQNSAYIRLKQLTLGYAIPKKLAQKVRVDRIRIYCSGNNLWESTKMLPVADPEMVNALSYPIYRSMSFGVNIDL